MKNSVFETSRIEANKQKEDMIAASVDDGKRPLFFAKSSNNINEQKVFCPTSDVCKSNEQNMFKDAKMLKEAKAVDIKCDCVDTLLNTDVVCKEIDGIPVMVGKKMAERLPYILSEYSKSPQIAIVYLDDIADIARNIAVLLSNAGWKVFELSISSIYSLEKQNNKLTEIPEYIKFAVAIGSGRITELCSLLSKRKNIDFALFATAPSTDCYLCAVKTPKFIIADEDILKSCPKQLIAAGVGIVLSQPLKNFERRVESILYETSYTKFEIEEQNKFVKSFMKENETVNCVELFWQLINISKTNLRENFVSSGEILADILSRADNTRNFGEYVFVASYLLAGFYSCYLSNQCTDVLLPPDKVKTMKLLEKKCGFDYFSLVKRIDILTVNSYFRIKYIINEYKNDLLSELNSLDFKNAQKFWRRQYSDAGFWLSSSFSSKELLSLLALSGELAGGLLGYAKASGALENYI